MKVGSKKERNRPGRIVADEGQRYRLVAPAPGETYDTQQKKLPAKVFGRHRLIVNVGFTITWEGAQRAYAGDDQFHLDMENQVMFNMGCWDCEKPFEEIKDRPVCLAPESPS